LLTSEGEPGAQTLLPGFEPVTEENAAMNDDIPNLMLEHLRALRSGQDDMREDIREIKTRLTKLYAAAATRPMTPG
jgi:hypothetical protein